jgi:succinoglycan biosynthesis protein ExoM
MSLTENGPVSPHVAICALTFRRPEGLRALLDGLRSLDPPDPGVTVRVIIVDNDPTGSGEAVVRAAAASLPWPVTYEIEPRRGIAQGRNRAVATAAGADFVAFIDDDEVPDPAWLNELLAVQRSTGADIVTGPVLPRFAERPPAWVVDGAFFERPRFRTGTTIHYSYTSNVLIASSVFRGEDRPFAEWFVLSGGDDTHFFLRARLNGHRIVWADEATVVETIPASRVDVGWLVRREYRRGNTLSLCLRDLVDSPLRRLRRAGQGLFRIVQGVTVLASAVARGRAAAVRGIQRVAFGVGLLTGLAGVRYDEYTEVHGA